MLAMDYLIIATNCNSFDTTPTSCGRQTCYTSMTFTYCPPSVQVADPALAQGYAYLRLKYQLE